MNRTPLFTELKAAREQIRAMKEAGDAILDFRKKPHPEFFAYAAESQTVESNWLKASEEVKP